MRIIPPALFLYCCFRLASLHAADAYTFRVEGKDTDPGILQRTGENIAPGDIVFIRDVPLMLGEPGAYHFTFKDGVVQRLMSDGSSEIVACDIADQYDESAPVETRFQRRSGVRNPLADLDDAALKKLRGVSISTWTEGLEKQLAKLDLERVCLRLQSSAIQDRIPPLPTGTRTLIVDSGGSWTCKDMSGFAPLKELRFLDLNRTSPDEFDFALLKGMPLEYLSLPWTQQAVHFEEVARLTSLETLVANYISYLDDGRWIASLTKLRTLYASHVGTFARDEQPVALDLAALGKLEKLEGLHVQSSAVKSLPASTMPSLKKSSLLLCTAPPAMVDAFASANPQATMLRSMNAELSKRLEKADKVRARSGGVCHRQESEEKIIHESRDSAVIKELAAHFKVAESDSGGHCMCCGNPTFEFYQGDKLVAMIAFHHGRSVRWADGVWPGDGMLTQDSARFLADWLDKHGYSGPKDEMLRSRRAQEAAKRRNDRYKALMPPSLYEALDTVDSLEGLKAAFLKHVPGAQDRGRLYLKLLGCEDSTWGLYSSLDSPLCETLVGEIPEKDLREIITQAPAESEEGLGAARWIFGESHVDLIKDDQKTIERLARFALTHPRQRNRWHTLTALRDLDSPQALTLLREVMKQGTKPRKLSEDELHEPDGQVTYGPRDIGLPAGTADEAAAALCLALIKSEPDKADVQAIRSGLPAKTAEEWDQTLQRAEERAKRETK
ncbi:hypothetical protein [Brevifollis gellanilyticus]|uniref:Uncharacterized protein n=1 Tax=Brevifollis gellanilyticus TaxID=748831 RepID=A0A512M448_9BACT|nr:hypothetical protein [Brevifollis gellanilyticus]GEP41520.1 hypothetical protein BGE01nite_08110 [Brevifollis gellanilyticus]